MLNVLVSIFIIPIMFFFALFCAFDLAKAQEEIKTPEEIVVEKPKEYFKVSEKIYLVDETAVDVGLVEARIAQLNGMIAQAQAEIKSLEAQIQNIKDTARDLSSAVTAEKEKK
jgi:cell division protein FtsL